MGATVVVFLSATSYSQVSVDLLLVMVDLCFNCLLRFPASGEQEEGSLHVAIPNWGGAQKGCSDVATPLHIPLHPPHTHTQMLNSGRVALDLSDICSQLCRWPVYLQPPRQSKCANCCHEAKQAVLVG